MRMAGRSLFLLTLAICVWSQTQKPLRQRILKADPAKYHSIRDGNDWHNPKLFIRPDGIEIIGITPSGHVLAVDSVPERLEHLPDSAWPLGLIVMVSDAGIQVGSVKDYRRRIEANRSRLLKVLTAHGIAVDLWPSA